MVDNPDFQGEWHAKKIENPAYKGEWAPKQTANPNYEEGVQLAAYDSAMLGFELWIVNNGTIFDNILVTDDIEYAKAQVRHGACRLRRVARRPRSWWGSLALLEDPPQASSRGRGKPLSSPSWCHSGPIHLCAPGIP